MIDPRCAAAPFSNRTYRHSRPPMARTRRRRQRRHAQCRVTINILQNYCAHEVVFGFLGPRAKAVQQVRRSRQRRARRRWAADQRAFLARPRHRRQGRAGRRAIGAGVYFLAPASVKQALLNALSGGAQSSSQTTASSGGACQASATNGKACDFSRAVLASTEEVWAAQFKQGNLPNYGGTPPITYPDPTLVVFSNSVSTGGCGNATLARSIAPATKSCTSIPASTT